MTFTLLQYNSLWNVTTSMIRMIYDQLTMIMIILRWLRCRSQMWKCLTLETFARWRSSNLRSAWCVDGGHHLFFIIVLKHIDDDNVLVNLHEGWVLIPWVVVSEVRISRWSCRWCCGCCCCCCRCGRGCCRGWSGGWRAGCGGGGFILGEVDRHLDVAQSILSQSSSNFWSRIFSSSKF